MQQWYVYFMDHVELEQQTEMQCVATLPKTSYTALGCNSMQR